MIPTIDNNATLLLPIHDSCCHLSHSEDDDIIINNAKIFYNPQAVANHDTERNIKFTYKNDGCPKVNYSLEISFTI
jgi:hypothetical protein